VLCFSPVQVRVFPLLHSVACCELRSISVLRSVSIDEKASKKNFYLTHSRFEVMALFPLFPGQNEMDQLQKIHSILGTPNEEVLRKFKLNSDVAFPEKKGTGIDHLIPHASLEVLGVLKKLLRYDPEERITARHGLLSSYFEEAPERTLPMED